MDDQLPALVMAYFSLVQTLHKKGVVQIGDVASDLEANYAIWTAAHLKQRLPALEDLIQELRKAF
ncbi:hypothetical protein [Paraburkholderia unamae]|uniref:Uncharacterized protein n=1 Tax=Paraburkholderia unamae TaxID=219649 RepID=A0ABX5KL89_9BURK|nr:hypothetical protein [Paraburkholderia unamae]PVX77193.1 hypothetical protein C7402_115252 [Paraburkholderia unamae]